MAGHYGGSVPLLTYDLTTDEGALASIPESRSMLTSMLGHRYPSVLAAALEALDRAERELVARLPGECFMCSWPIACRSESSLCSRCEAVAERVRSERSPRLRALWWEAHNNLTAEERTQNQDRFRPLRADP